MSLRTVLLPGTGIKTSAIGMGCASLGSRIAPAQGRRMLDAAFERGVTWFDVAPSYGAGRAEDILAPFLTAHRDAVFICSKVGLAPPRHNELMRAVYMLGRPVIGLAKGLRKKFRAMPSTRNVRVPLSPEMIETSLHTSLRRLGTGYLDVFALHDPDPTDLDRDEILLCLELIRTRGDARYISVAGSPEAAGKATGHPVFTFMQLADDPKLRPLARLRSRLTRPVATITHSILGVGGARDTLAARLGADEDLAFKLAVAGHAGAPDRVATRLLMRRAFASNPEGVVLASMYSTAHLDENVALADADLDPAAALLCERIFAEKSRTPKDGVLPASEALR